MDNVDGALEGTVSRALLMPIPIMASPAQVGHDRARRNGREVGVDQAGRRDSSSRNALDALASSIVISDEEASF